MTSTAIRFILSIAVLLLLDINISAHAGLVDTSGKNLDVALITYGPGDTYWKDFGHDALQLRDRVSGQSINFNYGMFNFNQKHFFLNFALGHMYYLMAAEYSAPEEAFYASHGRSVVRQQLTLNPAQAAALRDFLIWNIRPEHAGYHYDYYTDNCATRVRDALNKVLGGAIKDTLTTYHGNMTYRQQTDRLMHAQPWLMLLTDLGLGAYADQPLNAWQESFLPSTLQKNLRRIQVMGHHPLVQHELELFPNRLTLPPPHAPNLAPILGGTGLLIAGLLLMTYRYWRTGFALLGTVYLIPAGLIGLALLAFWTLTTHRAIFANANLLLFNPLAFALLPDLWQVAHNPSRTHKLLAIQGIALLTALLLHTVHGVVQQNQPWLCFAIPIWLTLGWCLHQSSHQIDRRLSDTRTSTTATRSICP